MKIISKFNLRPLGDKRGETIVEVIVAFSLLTIMLLIFSQGLAFASRSDIQAMQTRDKADKAMMDLQATKIDNPENKLPVAEIDSNIIYRQVYQIEYEDSGQIYSYVVYTAGN